MKNTVGLEGHKLPGEKIDIPQAQTTLNMCNYLIIMPSSFYH